MILQHTHWHRHGDDVHSHEHDWSTILPEDAERYVDGGKPAEYYPKHDFNHEHKGAKKEAVTA